MVYFHFQSLCRMLRDTGEGPKLSMYDSADKYTPCLRYLTSAQLSIRAIVHRRAFVRYLYWNVNASARTKPRRLIRWCSARDNSVVKFCNAQKQRITNRDKGIQVEGKYNARCNIILRIKDVLLILKNNWKCWKNYRWIYITFCKSNTNNLMMAWEFGSNWDHK